MGMYVLEKPNVVFSKLKLDLTGMNTEQRKSLLGRARDTSKGSSLNYLVAVDFTTVDFPKTMPSDFSNLRSIELDSCDINFDLLSVCDHLEWVKIKYPPPNFFDSKNAKIVIPKLETLILMLNEKNILPEDPSNLRICLDTVTLLSIRVTNGLHSFENVRSPILSKFLKNLSSENVPKLKKLIIDQSGFGPLYDMDLTDIVLLSARVRTLKYFGPGLMERHIEEEFAYRLCTFGIRSFDFDLRKWDYAQIWKLEDVIEEYRGVGKFNDMGNKIYRIVCN